MNDPVWLLFLYCKFVYFCVLCEVGFDVYFPCIETQQNLNNRFFITSTPIELFWHFYIFLNGLKSLDLFLSSVFCFIYLSVVTPVKQSLLF